MSTPFPFEEASQTYGRASFDPSAQPKTPEWYAGLGHEDGGASSIDARLAGLGGSPVGVASMVAPGALKLIRTGVLSGVAKGQAVLGGLLHTDTGIDYAVDESGGLAATEGAPPESVNALADRLSADAKAKVKANTPDATTTGAAGQMLHGLTSVGTEMAIGSFAGPLGAAAVVGSGEGRQRYLELIDAGVDKDTALKASGWTGVTAAAGAFVPGGFGTGLVTKVATGSVANTAFGMINRYADHRILDDAGYTQMAEQQKVIDGTQIITDLVLGAAFGGIAHLHETPQLKALQDAPGARDAALTANLAIKDRESAPGIPTDPEAANAHQSALESSIQSLMEGKPVDVSESRVTEADFLHRAEPRNVEAEHTVRNAVAAGEFFGEDNERDVQAILEGREPESVKSEPAATEEGYTVGEQELTDEQLKAFQGLRSDVQADEKLGGSGERESGESRNQNDGEPGIESGEPLKVFRGSDRELVAEHFGLDTLGKATGHPSSGLGVFFSKDRSEAARYGQVSEHNLDIKKPKIIKAEDLPGFDSTHSAYAYREKLRAQGYDGLVIDASHLGGPVNYVAFKPEQVFAAEKAAGAAPVKPREVVAKPRDPVAQALADHPGLMITDENGNPVSAHEALAQAQEEAATKTRESAVAAKAAITCYMRRGN